MTNDERISKSECRTKSALIRFWLLVILWSLVISHSSLRCSATIEHWDADRGLPDNTVLAITQTRDGYLWLGTLYGLVRFDAGAGRKQFPVFKEDNTPGLTSSQIVKLFEDSGQNLWIGTKTEGVVRVDKKGRITSLSIGRGSQQGALRAACEDKNGAVWLYTADGQLGRYQDGKLEGPWNWSDPSGGDCRGLAVDDTGLIWIGTDSSLSAIDPAAVKPGKPPVAVKRELFPFGTTLDFLLTSKSGGYWRLANGRIQKWRNGRMEKDLGDYPWRNQGFVTTACEDLEGNLIVGTYNVGAEQTAAVRSERSGVFWFRPGVKDPWIAVSHDSIFSVAVDREDCLWVGTNGRGLDRVKLQAFDVLEGTRNYVVQSVCDDRKGGLWIGYNGESRIDHWANGTLLRTPLRSNDIYISLQIRAVFVDEHANVWAGTAGGGLFHLEHEAFQAVRPAESLDPQITALYQDRNGLLWAGTEQGLGRFDGRSWRMFTNAFGAAANSVRAIADDA